MSNTSLWLLAGSLLLLTSCGPDPIQPEAGTVPTNNPVVNVKRRVVGITDTFIRVEIVTVEGKKFAVASYMDHISICEVTTHNVGQ